MLKLQNDYLLVEVSPSGGAITTARTRDGRNFLRPLDGPFQVRASSCFPLVPLGNRVRGNRFTFGGKDYRLRPNATDPLYIHGDGWLADWIVKHADTSSVILFLDHHPDFGVHRYRAVQRILLEANMLRITLEVENLGTEKLPFGLGFHPFMPNDDAWVEFKAQAFWTEGQDSLPRQRVSIDDGVEFGDGRILPGIWLNNAYEGWDGHAHICWPNRLRLELRADPIFTTLMVYAPDTDRSFFCLEPMSHLPDALHMDGGGGLHALEPGETLSGGIDSIVTEQKQAALEG